jgi:hypothetical protein
MRQKFLDIPKTTDMNNMTAGYICLILPRDVDIRLLSSFEGLFPQNRRVVLFKSTLG